jgi:peroxiredoxin
MKYIIQCLVLIYFSTSIFAQNQDSLNKANAASLLSAGGRLPFLNLENMDGVKMSPYDVPANKNLVLMILNLTCGHCVEQTALFLKEQKKFPNTFFLLVSAPNMKDYYAQFCRETGFVPQENMMVTFDMSRTIDTVFQYKGLPQLMIYGEDKKLKTIFHKDTKIEKILDALGPQLAATEPEAVPSKKKKRKKK